MDTHKQHNGSAEMFGALQKHYGTIVLLVLAVIPVWLWLTGTNALLSVANSSAFLSTLGKAAALSGLALYCLLPVLSMRHKVIEHLFGGLDKVYSLHAASGRACFYLILAHPLLLGAGRMLNGLSVTNLWNWSSAMILLGIVGFVGLFVVAIFTAYAHVKHQRWIRVHRIFGWLLPVFFAHALLAQSSIVQNRPLFTYFMILGSLGFAAFLYRSVFGKYLIRKYRYTVADVNRVSPMVTELVLKPRGIPINYTPGQFAYLSIRSDVIDEEAHPYSFTTANNGPYVRFAIKALGDDTAKLKNLAPGAKAYLEGPYGTFSYLNSRNKHQIWIAGGVGITPFLSMARSLPHPSDYRIHLFYAAEELEDAVFLQELIDIRRHLPHNFELTIVNRQISGFVTLEMVQKEIQDITAPDYFICGPPAMMQALKKQLIDNGVAEDQIHTEEFSML